MIISIILALTIATLLVLIVLVHVWHFRDQKTLRFLRCDQVDLQIMKSITRENQYRINDLDTFKENLEQNWNLEDKRFGRLLKKGH